MPNSNNSNSVMQSVQTKEVKNSSTTATGTKNVAAPNLVPLPAVQQTGPTAIPKIPGLSVFLTKTFNIFSIQEYAEKDWCSWGANGDTIVFKSIEQFSKNVLPKYFKHSNFQSFVRQLNMYDFRKTAQNPNHVEFQHQCFRQNRPDLLINIKRKPSRHKSLPNKSGTSSACSSSEMLGQRKSDGSGVCLCSCNFCASCINNSLAQSDSMKRKLGCSGTTVSEHALTSTQMHGADSDNYEFDDDQEDDDHDGDSMSGEYYESQAPLASSTAVLESVTSSASMMPILTTHPHGMIGDTTHIPTKMRAPVSSSVSSPSMLEARIERLEAENVQLKFQVEEVGLKSIVLQSILDEVLQLLGGRAAASAKNANSKGEVGDIKASSPAAVGMSESKSGGSGASTGLQTITEEFMEEAKKQILHNAMIKVRNFNIPNQFPMHMYSILYPASYGMNGTILGTGLMNSVEFTTFDEVFTNDKFSAALHSFDGMELSRLREPPSSFDLAASSIQQPCPMHFNIQHTNSFYDGNSSSLGMAGANSSSMALLPSMNNSRASAIASSDPPVLSSSLELLSTSVDILTERDTMSSHDHSNFAAANAAIGLKKESVRSDDIPLAKKQRGSYEVPLKGEETVGASTTNVDTRSSSTTDVRNTVVKLEPPTILTASQHANEPLRRQDAVIFDPVTIKLENAEHPAPAELMRFDSNVSNFSRLDSLDSALTTILRNI